jgi:formamidopyrimidine-DNA glycosylase
LVVGLTDEEKREKLDQHYEAIKDAELQVQEAESGMIRAQHDLKDSKKEYEGAVLHLRGQNYKPCPMCGGNGDR